MKIDNIVTLPRKALPMTDVAEYVNLAESSELPSMVPLQVSFLRNFTVEGIDQFSKYHCFKSGIKANLVYGNYDMVRQESLDKASHLYTTFPDIIVIAIYLDTFLPDGWRGDWSPADVMGELSGLFTDILKNTDSHLVVNTFIPPFYSDNGIASDIKNTDCLIKVQQLNQMVREFVQSNSSRFVLVDWERLVRLLGEDESLEYRFWYMSKAPFKNNFLDLYAAEIAKVARALKGKAKKCLVLDCDNTLWGGIIGEDGLHGIKLDQHNYPGNAFYDFQKRVLQLYNRGVLIALCSKNNEQDVWDVLDTHPFSLLNRKHLCAWRVNWQDKAMNIRGLAEELNLGLDSFVFIDDNPVECALVEDLIPDVTVIQVPKKLYLYPPILDIDGLFDALALSNEDVKRSEMYRNEANRKQDQAKYESLDQYLESLSICISVHSAGIDEVPRVAQLTQKTNQFNLTTHRYSDAQITSFADDDKYEVLSLTVTDKFGQSGLTGVIVAKFDGDIIEIDTLLMSCRILGRNIEVAFVLRAIEIFECKWGCCQIRAEYLQTKKNQQVKNFWSRMGFSEIFHRDEEIVYELTTDGQRHESIPYITIEE